jgi:hemerythrin-like metal-binding protein
MAATHRSGALSLDLPFMDQAHEQFTALLKCADDADDAQLPAAWRAVVELTAENFAHEDEWMQSTRFSSRKDHTLQHRVVLEVMREGIAQADQGRLLEVRQMAWQFRDWYHKHVQTMDAALALHLRGMRFEPANGVDEPSGVVAAMT